MTKSKAFLRSKNTVPTISELFMDLYHESHNLIKAERERERQTDRQRDRQRERQREIYQFTIAPFPIPFFHRVTMPPIVIITSQANVSTVISHCVLKKANYKRRTNYMRSEL